MIQTPVRRVVKNLLVRKGFESEAVQNRFGSFFDVGSS